YFTATANLADAIQDLNTPVGDGFQIGANAVVNTLSGSYYYAAFAESNPPPPPTGHFTMTKGVYTGNGSARSITGLGFRPELVIVKDIASYNAVFRTQAMFGDKTAYFSAGTADIAGGITSLDADGFSLGTNATVNTAAGTYYWEAFDIPTGGAIDFQVGSYVGNGVDNRSITGVGFKPDMVVVKSSPAIASIWRTSNHVGDISSYHNNVAEAADLIQEIEPDGFQIGTTNNVNSAGNVYWWFAFKSGPNFSVGSYIADGLDNKSVTGVGFQPDLVWVKGNTSQNGVYRSSSLPANESQYFANNLANITTGIKSMTTDGFTVGTHATVNTASTVYRYAAWKATDDTSAGTVSALAQYQSDGVTAIALGGALTNPSSVFKFSMAHSSATATLTPQIEIKATGTDFDGLNLLTGSAVDYSGTPVIGSVTSARVSLNINYHWRARMKDQNGNYSPWVSFGGNAEAETDFTGLAGTVISSNTTWTTDQTFTNLQITNNAVVTVDSINKVGGAGQIVVTVTGDLVVDFGASISANEKGYAGATGPGAGTTYGAGGGYGGRGGCHAGVGCGVSYGSLTSPTDLGSGAYQIGTGGGSIKLIISNSSIINGSITANGKDGSRNGGGSGGSIWIITNMLEGNGSIGVRGGAGGGGDNTNPGGAGGGGGRISLQYTNKTYTGSIAASGGTGSQVGDIGTINKNGQNFVCDLGTLNDTCTISSAQNMVDGDIISGSGNLIIASGGNIVNAPGSKINISMGGDITIQSGGTIIANATITATNLTINSGGLINVNSLGYLSNSGPGAGSGSGGGGYGGVGGASVGGAVYGSLIAPTDLGSGGVFSLTEGGFGGGAVKLIVTDTTTINGSITSIGGNGDGHNSGGSSAGSGGSIWITTNIFNGSGTISVNGGSGNQNAGRGSGGGGRISIQYASNNYTGAKTAYGAGTGFYNGGAGTVYLKSAAQTYGELYINNNAQTTGVTPLPVTGGNGGGAALWQFDNDLSGVTNGGYLQIPTGVTLAIPSTTSTISGTGGIVAVSNGGTLSAPNMTSATIAGILTLDTGSTFTTTLLSALTVSGTLNINNTQSLALESLANTGTINLNSGGILSLPSITQFSGTGVTNINNGGELSLENVTVFNLDGTINLNTGGTLSLPALTDLTVSASKTLTLNPSATFTAASLGVMTVNGTISSNGAYSFPAATMTINSGGVLTHGTNTTDKVNYMDLSLNSLMVNTGGTINVNSKGHTGGNGQGGACAMAGAGYGGAGGASSGGCGVAGATYGSSTAPVDLGSGGGAGWGSGFPGGGAVKITATGTTTINGSITANGGTPGNGNWDSGAGSGGSIWINTNTLAGNGSIAADGGNNITYYTPSGGGGGGRIAINYTTKTYTGSVSTAGQYLGGLMGTITRNGQNFVCDSGTLNDTCTVSSLQIMSDGDTISGSGNLIIANGGNITSEKNSRYTIAMTGDVTIQSGGLISGNPTINAANLAINNGGSINATTKGPFHNAGTGKGTNSNSGASGGGYGGAGGAGAVGGGQPYGSMTQPIDLGSSGGIGNYGAVDGYGGGAVKVIVSGITTIDGSLLANGGNGAGGGSGGSIWINTNSLVGAASGFIAANGGTGAGGGGGGRVSIQYVSKNYSGSVTTTGGTGSLNNGSVGTVYTVSSVVTTPADGSLKNGNPTISGTAATIIGSLVSVEVLVKDNAADNCWDGSTWSTCPTDSDDWPDATGTDDWSYAGLAAENYIDGHNYTVRSRATDSSYMEVPAIGKTFTYDITNPSVVLSYDPSRPVGAADTMRVTATFDEAVLDSPVPQVAVSYAGGGSLVATNMLKTDDTHYYYDIDVPSGSDGSATVTISNAQDLATNPNNTATNNTFTVDNTGPVSLVTAPADNADLSSLATITGTATDAASGVTSVQVSIKDLGTDGAGATWYNGSTFGDSSETWQSASGTTSWTYTAPTWTHNHQYLIRAKAIDTISNEEIPGAGNTFLFWNGTIISTSVALSGSYTNLLVTNGSSPTIAGNTTITVSGDLRVRNSSNIIANSTNTNQDSGGVGVTIDANNITVDSGSTINANGTGYASDHGPGRGSGITGGSTYGSLISSNLGSGGATSATGQAGGSGGGAITFNVSGITTISGSITANGANGINAGSYNSGGGGGSGGSIGITTGVLRWTGLVGAIGGSGGLDPSGSLSYNGGGGAGYGGMGGDSTYAHSAPGGGGAGGRIAVYFTTINYSGSLAISGGSGYHAGGAGTIYGLSPISAITAPAEGNYKNSSFATISGTAISLAGTLSGVSVSIKDTTDGTHWYNGSNFTTATTEQWLSATGTTSWTYARPTLTDGHAYLIRSRAADSTAFSPETPLAGTSFTYDNTAPTTAVTITDAQYNTAGWNSTSTINGTASDATSGVTLTEIAILRQDGSPNHWWNGTDWNATSETWIAVTTGTTAWYYTLSEANLTDGKTYTVKARATDAAGNITTTGFGTDDFAYDTTPPVAAVTLSNSYYNATTWNQASTINGTASDVTSSVANVQLEIQDNTSSGNYWTGSTWSSTETWLSASGTTAWSYNLDKANLTSGHNYTITARATDSAGNLMSTNYATGDFNYDSIAPVISFVDDVSSSPTQNDTINITISDSFPDATSFKYLLSPDTDCSSKNYALGTAFNSGVAFNFATQVNNNKYICVRADDLAGNVSYLVSGNVLNIDITKPTSAITNPDGTTPEYYQMSSITGAASDNNSLGTIYVSIKDTTDGTHFWSGTDWSITDENNSWLPATGTTTWTFNSTGVLWSVNNSYLIKSKAIDAAGNNEIPATGNSFTFVNSSPTVSNLTATQKNDGEANAGQIEVSYDVSDLESSTTTINLFYASGATLDSTITNGTTTNNILTSDVAHFPDSGTIIIKSGTGATTRYEYIAYTGKSANYLTGITRHTEGTVGTAHDAGEEILIKANSLSGDFGSVNNGTGKALIWDAATDTSFYESALTVRISSNDGASTNNVGLADSATFEFDSKKPAVTSANIDAREAIPGGTPATLNLNVSDDTAKQMLISLNADFSGATWVAYTNTPTITLTTNPDTVYLKFKDAKGNTTDDQILTTPNTPGSVMIQDISSAAQDKWRLYVSWQIISTPAPGFDAYQVYRAATQNGTYSYLGATVADNINADYYSDTVNFDDTYYYKVTSKDDNGNYSFYSNYMHGTANAILDAGEGGGGTGGDVTPPQILTGPTATPTNNAASITWTTDEIADSYIEYGEDTSYGSVFGISTNGTDHSVTLPETLSGSTLYHYRIRARDISGNLTLSSDFNFTTTAGGDITPPTISAVNSTSITSTSATITFTTNENSSSYIDYGTVQNVYTKTTGNSADATMSHTVNLTALTPNTTYYYRVRSVDGSGNEATDANSGNYSFQTLSSPTITNPTAINITDTEATITYTTSSNAYGFVDYGVTNTYGQVRGDDANVHTAQSIQLADLTPGTTYHYRPRIKDIYGNYTFDATDYTFETASSDAPVLQSLTSTTADGIYGPASSINLTATYNQTLATNSSITVTLNTGAQIILNTISNDTKLIGTYTVGATGSNQNTNALSVSTIALQNVCNANSNCLTGTTLPGENINTHSTLIIDTTAPVFSSITPDNSGNIASLTTSSDISY
ncbi:MAG: fibronectin type III domain-containing protein, partial [Candidatus Moraniibacteriota bacterium]